MFFSLGEIWSVLTPEIQKIWLEETERPSISRVPKFRIQQDFVSLPVRLNKLLYIYFFFPVVYNADLLKKNEMTRSFKRLFCFCIYFREENGRRYPGRAASVFRGLREHHSPEVEDNRRLPSVHLVDGRHPVHLLLPRRDVSFQLLPLRIHFLRRLFRSWW